MGTRGITRVIKNAESKISQYGQWDHYPSGQGITILKILRNIDLEKFSKQLDKCRFTNQKDSDDFDLYCESIGAKNGWANSSQSDLINAKYPLLSRDLGGVIINEVYESELDSIVLAECKDANWVEGIYTINLDDNTFNVQYYNFDETFSLLDLPSDEDFLNKFNEKDEE